MKSKYLCWKTFLYIFFFNCCLTKFFFFFSVFSSFSFFFSSFFLLPSSFFLLPPPPLINRYHIPAVTFKADPNDTTKIISIQDDMPSWSHKAFGRVTHLNRMQSICSEVRKFYIFLPSLSSLPLPSFIQNLFFYLHISLTFFFLTFFSLLFLLLLPLLPPLLLYLLLPFLFSLPSGCISFTRESSCLCTNRCW